MDVAARSWLMQALGRCCLALRDPDCLPLLGPTVPGATLPLGARVPGTSLELEPASAAFNLGAMIRGEQPCAADHVAALLAAADYVARHAHYDGVAPPTVGDLIAALVRADALARAPAGGLPASDDPASQRRAADAFVVAALLGGSPLQQWEAARRACLDGAPRVATTGLSDGQRGASLARERRRCAGENAARSVRHALAVLREGPADGFAASVAVSPASECGAPGSPQARPDAGFEQALAGLYPPAQAAAIVALFQPGPELEALAVDAFLARLVRN